jgi:hypothetical protein
MRRCWSGYVDVRYAGGDHHEPVTVSGASAGYVAAEAIMRAVLAGRQSPDGHQLGEVIEVSMSLSRDDAMATG